MKSGLILCAHLCILQLLSPHPSQGSVGIGESLQDEGALAGSSELKECMGHGYTGSWCGFALCL